jgi:hypothetical protein
MKKDKFFVPGMLAMVLVLGLVFSGCATGGNDTDDDYEVWGKEQYYTTEADPWISDDDHFLTLVFTEAQLKFRYDSNDDGDFEDTDEYTYTYTITDFEGNDWWQRGNDMGGDYTRRVIADNETKTGSGTNTDLTNMKEFWVEPELGGNGKLDGNIYINGSTIVGANEETPHELISFFGRFRKKQ